MRPGSSHFREQGRREEQDGVYVISFKHIINFSKILKLFISPLRRIPGLIASKNDCYPSQSRRKYFIELH